MRDMAALDVFFAVNELRNLIGGHIQKVYQNGKAVWFEIYVPGKGAFTLYSEPGKIFVTEYKRAAPEQPENFAMFCRKHVGGQKVTDVRQHGFDRIIELETEKNIVIFEIFSKGNVIICDRTYKIIMPLEVQIWKGRQLVPRKPYLYPPEAANPFKLSESALHGLFSGSDKDIVRFLAMDLSLSGMYAEEVCARAQIDKNKPCKQLNESERIAIYESLHSLRKQFSPQLVFENQDMVDAVPFELLTYKSKRQQTVPTFVHALDEIYTQGAVLKIETEKTKIVDDRVGKIERIAEQQRTDIERLKRTESESRAKAEAIQRNVELVQNTITDVMHARSAGESWEQMKSRLKSEKAVKEIKEREGKIVFELS